MTLSFCGEKRRQRRGLEARALYSLEPRKKQDCFLWRVDAVKVARRESLGARKAPSGGEWRR
jgi:hypothetical protein